MATEDIEFEQNAGTAEQLPQGAAGGLNELLPTTTVSEPDSLVPVPDTTQFPGGPSAAGDPPFKPHGREEEILFDDVDDEFPAPVQLPAGRLPDSVVRLLPLMRESTNPSLRAVYLAAVNALDESLR